MPSSSHSEIYADLRELAQGSFPKRCNSCGRRYDTADDFVQVTHAINPNHSGLKQSVDDDGQAILELFRNCPCGSTLLDFFQNRRDVHLTGVERRKNFDKLLLRLGAKGIEIEVARRELLKLLRGESSDMMKLIPPDD